MSEASRLADDLNKKLDSLHDPVISGNPFSWSDSFDDRKKRENVWREIVEKLSAYKHVSKAGTIFKLILFGVLAPLAILGLLFYMDLPADETARLIVWGGLGLIAFGSGVAAAVIGYIPSIDDEITLAAYTIPRGWSFSKKRSHELWELYREKFSYFKRGDENRYIGTRVWGHADPERDRPFQMFHFHYDTVYYVPVTHTSADGKSTYTTMEKRVNPHNRYGIFLTVPEAKARFRITEIGGDAGLDSDIKLEFGELNEALDIYCDAKDELAIRQFLSPAVQEVILGLSQELPGMLIDFYSGFMLLVSKKNFFGEFETVSLNNEASHFMERIEPAIKNIESFRVWLSEEVDRVRKYND